MLAYIVLVLVLGGASAAGEGANLLLQLLAALLMGWRLWLGPVEVSGPLRWTLGAALLLILVQFVPLPPALWESMAWRGNLAAGYTLAGLPQPWLTVSLAPWRSLASLAHLIVPGALFCAMRGQCAPGRTSVAWMVVAGGAVSLVLGLLQWGTGQGYLYAVTNYGRGPGFFANSNHQAGFLLMAFAIGVWLFVQSRDGVTRVALAVLAGGLVLGLAINPSLACLTLFPIEVMALALVLRPDWRRRTIVIPMVFVGAILLAGIMWLPGSNDLSHAGTIPGLSRREFWENGVRIVCDTLPWGTGLGSFADVYRWYENPAFATDTFVNHAHNDWLELIIEGGVFALVAMLAGAFWLTARAAALWATGSEVRMSAQVALVGVIIALTHSLVDYPLRTAAFAGVFAILCAWVDEG